MCPFSLNLSGVHLCTSPQAPGENTDSNHILQVCEEEFTCVSP